MDIIDSLITFNSAEDFSGMPAQGRMSLIFIPNTNKCRILLNRKTISPASPYMLLISYFDEITAIADFAPINKSISFKPEFINSNLSFERIKAGDYRHTDEIHDGGLMELFMKRGDNYTGVIGLQQQECILVSGWMADIENAFSSENYALKCGAILRKLLQILFLLDDLYVKHMSQDKLSDDESIIRTVKEYIHENFNKEISLKSLCGLARINRTSLNEKFKKFTGRSPMEYLQFYRLNIACEMLTHSKISVSKIAEVSGYKYDTYFIRLFTLKIGVTPAEYRQSEGFETLGGRFDSL